MIMNECNHSRLYLWTHLDWRCDGILPTNEALRPCVNASRSVISHSVIMIVVLLFLPYWASESMRCRHHWQPFPRTAPWSTRAGSSMLSSFPVAWKLKGCTERAPNCKAHFQWRVAATSAALSTSSPSARGPDGSQAKHWPNRLFGSALIFWRIFLAWKTHDEKEGKAVKTWVCVRVCVWVIKTRIISLVYSTLFHVIKKQLFRMFSAGL